MTTRGQTGKLEQYSVSQGHISFRIQMCFRLSSAIQKILGIFNILSSLILASKKIAGHIWQPEKGNGFIQFCSTFQQRQAEIIFMQGAAVYSIMKQ